MMSFVLVAVVVIFIEVYGWKYIITGQTNGQTML